MNIIHDPAVIKCVIKNNWDAADILDVGGDDKQGIIFIYFILSL